MRVLRNIDGIARDLNRDVVYLTFNTIPAVPENEHLRYFQTDTGKGDGAFLRYFCQPNENENRQIILKWLFKKKIGYEDCFGIAFPECHECWNGQLYLDFAIDSKEYHLFQKFYDETDGGWSKKFFGVRYYMCPLSFALTNVFEDSWL